MIKKHPVPLMYLHAHVLPPSNCDQCIGGNIQDVQYLHPIYLFLLAMCGVRNMGKTAHLFHEVSRA
ncbi:ORF1134 [White spot syndrome virus]|uniref:ORF1134 n=1 Tax=White spot syndrome virus TaxID=342409 RepID=A0A2D3I6W7_9VIRU|nr:ORF1134 [White spot syndrome virus]